MRIDARMLACPLPVIKTKQALQTHTTVTTIVDNKIAVQNLQKMAAKLNLHCELVEEVDSTYLVTIRQFDLEIATSEVEKVDLKQPTISSYSIVIDTDTMGQGDKRLGQTLLKGFVYALTEQSELPEHVIFYNAGAHFVTADSVLLTDLKALKTAGVLIYVCGACVDFYGLQDKIAVGEITNMYHIVELLRLSAKVIKP
ncbi:sulfurtransferase-like selenium metabolism protein YedF [Listeria sp. FSL L7-0091]|uniref:sulfurtransferase-like selenium metabolism protein YedF n=1 Tax=Listeria farberi TaxID=2713500 RepID=UPI0016242A79|nr:sulfurtransferase-like selenium metabolism protein YedF [Listeria farberi]MBC2262520.1 sulfurtransferase-like selenium metabolism protein YedF [Listeria farberi]